MTVWLSFRIPRELWSRLIGLQKRMAKQSQQKVPLSKTVIRAIEKGLEALNQ